MKLPVMMNASGIKKIVIDGSIVWERAASNCLWSRHGTDRTYVQSKSDEKLMKYVRHLIQNQGYTNVWTSGDTLNVAKYTPEELAEIQKKISKDILRNLDKLLKTLPKIYIPGLPIKIRDQGERGTSVGNSMAYGSEMARNAAEKAMKRSMWHCIPRPIIPRRPTPVPDTSIDVKVGDHVCMLDPAYIKPDRCYRGVVEQIGPGNWIRIRHSTSSWIGMISNMSQEAFELNYIWIAYRE